MYLSLRGAEEVVFRGWMEKCAVFFFGWEKSRIFALGL